MTAKASNGMVRSCSTPEWATNGRAPPYPDKSAAPMGINMSKKSNPVVGFDQRARPLIPVVPACRVIEMEA